MEPNNPVQPVQPVQPTEPAEQPVQPVTPMGQSQPVVNPEAGAVPQLSVPVVPQSAAPQSAAPQPAAQAADVQSATQPASAPISAQFANPNPVNPVVNPTGSAAIYQGGIAATDPITMPTPPPAPDPIEEELKAPLKAAAPVPGSIGSAVSMPADNSIPSDDAVMNAMAQTPSVAFNDPAKVNAVADNTKNTPAKKKLSKTTLILLCALALAVVVVLAVILITQLI